MQMDTTRNAIHTTICTKGPGDSSQRARKSSPVVEIEIKVMQPPESLERTVKNMSRSNYPTEDTGLVGGPGKQLLERNKVLYSIEELGSERWY